MTESTVDQESGEGTTTEIDAALGSDTRKIGDVWRALKAGADVAAISSQMGWAAPRPVYSYRTYINVLRGVAPPPTKPTMALQCGRQIGSFIRRHSELSNEAKDSLEQRRQRCESNADEYDLGLALPPSPRADVQADRCHSETAGPYSNTDESPTMSTNRMIHSAPFTSVRRNGSASLKCTGCCMPSLIATLVA